MNNPEVVWCERVKGVWYRLVRVDGELKPEERAPDDAMGGASWSATPWHKVWMERMAEEIVKSRKK